VTAACTLCGAVGQLHRHHVTGRPGPGAAYLDPGLVVALCVRCHVSVHQALRAVGLDSPAGRGSLRHRLLRVGCTAELVGGAGRPLILSPPSTRALGGLARDAADALDGEAVGR